MQCCLLSLTWMNDITCSLAHLHHNSPNNNNKTVNKNYCYTINVLWDRENSYSEKKNLKLVSKPGFTQRCPHHSISTMALADLSDYGSKIHLILPVLILLKILLGNSLTCFCKDIRKQNILFYSTWDISCFRVWVSAK